MDTEKIIKLIKSPNLEDTQIGLSILVNNYTEEEIKEFFNKYGEASVGFYGVNLLSSKGFIRNVSNFNWQYFYKDKIAFWAGRHTIFGDNVLMYTVFNPIEL